MTTIERLRQYHAERLAQVSSGDERASLTVYELGELLEQIDSKDAEIEYLEGCIQGLTGCIDRRDDESDANIKSILDLCGDQALAKDNPSWSRVIDALKKRSTRLDQFEAEQKALADSWREGRDR